MRKDETKRTLNYHRVRAIRQLINEIFGERECLNTEEYSILINLDRFSAQLRNSLSK